MPALRTRLFTVRYGNRRRGSGQRQHSASVGSEVVALGGITGLGPGRGKVSSAPRVPSLGSSRSGHLNKPVVRFEAPALNARLWWALVLRLVSGRYSSTLASGVKVRRSLLSSVASSAPWATHPLPRWGLTPRSSGAPTAGHQARSGGTRYIFASPGLASCRRRPLSSNVRQRNGGYVVIQQSQRLAARAEQPQRGIAASSLALRAPHQLSACSRVR